jgi:hypothetical protein
MVKAIPTVEEFTAYIGKGSRDYIDAWMPAIEGGGKISGFNFAAFLFSGLWMAYRKMYRYALIFFGVIIAFTLGVIILFLGILGGNITPPYIIYIFDIIIGVIVGIKGNQLYFSSAMREINRIHAQNLSQEDCMKLIVQKGGTNIWKALALTFLFFVVYIVLGLIVGFIIIMIRNITGFH